MTATYAVAAIIDAVAGVIAGAVAGNIFAAGVTQEVTDPSPLVVPLADDFTEVGLPIVTCALGGWHPTLAPGLERYGNSNPLEVLCAVWRPRVPLGENVALLYGDRDAIVDAFIDHTKAGLVVPELQTAILAGGPGIVPRSLPRIGESQRPFLTLPFTVNVTINRTVVPQPA